MVQVTILLPTFNEESTIRNTIDDIMEFAPDSNILVIDSHSTDRTTEIAGGMGATVISIPGRGKGRAVRTALKEVILPCYKTPCYIMLDSDFTYPAQYIPRMIAMLDKGADVVMGYRRYKSPGSMTFVNNLGNKALSFLAGMLYDYWVPDVCTGMWGFRREALERFSLTSNGFTLEADLFGNAMKTKCKVRQLPISYRARPDGSHAKLKVRDGFAIGWFLIKNKFRR